MNTNYPNPENPTPFTFTAIQSRVNDALKSALGILGVPLLLYVVQVWMSYAAIKQHCQEYGIDYYGWMLDYTPAGLVDQWESLLLPGFALFILWIFWTLGIATIKALHPMMAQLYYSDLRIFRAVRRLIKELFQRFLKKIPDSPISERYATPPDEQLRVVALFYFCILVLLFFKIFTLATERTIEKATVQAKRRLQNPETIHYALKHDPLGQYSAGLQVGKTGRALLIRPTDDASSGKLLVLNSDDVRVMYLKNPDPKTASKQNKP